MKPSAHRLATFLLLATLGSTALPALAQDSTNTVMGQALSFCIDTLTSQAATPAALQSGGFGVTQRSATRLSARKDSADATIHITLRNLRNCSAEVSPRIARSDARASTLLAIDAWAKSKQAIFLPAGQGSAVIMANNLTFPVVLKALPIRGGTSTVVEIQRKK